MLVTVLAAMPLAAQSQNSLVDNLAADSTGQFTSLVAALEAAGLAETLSADGDYTLFAPTNDALDAAVEALGTTLPALLGDTELLTQILTYHVVAGDRVFFREFSRNPSLTTLEGGELTLSVDDGVPTVNGVTFSGIDRASSNGVYHIVDAVLLPPVLAALTPEATDAALDDAEAMLRFAFLSLDSPPLVLAINGEPVDDATPFEYPAIGEWMSVPAGTMTISGAPEGEGIDDLLSPFELTLQAGTWTTLAIVGSEPNGTYIAQPVLEDYSPISDGNARVTVFHAIENGPMVDVTVDGRTVVSQLGYPLSRGDNDGAFVIEIPAGTVYVQAFQSGMAAQPGATALVDLPNTTFEPNSNTFFAIIGTPGQPDSAAATVDMSDVLSEAR